MFLKPFKVKSNHQLKVTDKKHLKEEFKKRFPSLTSGNLDELLPKKELVSMMKVETATRVIIQIYVVNKRAIAFIHENVLFPSVYFMWQYPDIALTFTTHDAVISKLQAGAHLMLPGVVYPVLNNIATIPKFLGNALACVNSTSNKAAIAVGVTAQSSIEVTKSENRGKCVIIYHVYGDKLCTLENLSCPRLPDIVGLYSFDEATIQSESMGAEENLNADADDSPDFNSEDDISGSGESNVNEMDELFSNCFLAAIKYSKDLTFPVLTSTFYKVFMIPACPGDKTLDVKKTSFKKLSQFLQSMAEAGIIKIEEAKKGVSSISDINREHPLLIEFNLDPADRPVRASKEDDASETSVVEAHSVTAKVFPVFLEFGFIKGSVITNSEIRKYITEYVKNHNLQNSQDKNSVNMNETLRLVCNIGLTITWPKLMEKFYNSMSPCYKITCGENVVIRKGKLETINITVAKRSGNKKVTLIDNLEVYGINIEELATSCQRGVAASTNINHSQTVKKTDQLQIQGNQVLFVYNLLIDKYKMPKKFIKGLEFAPKKKK